MDLFEASKFYGSYQALCDETRDLLCEIFDEHYIHQEILSCDTPVTDL